MALRSRLSRNTVILLTSNVGSALLAFILSVLIGRAFGGDGLGVYAAALAWVYPLSLAAEFGLGTLMTRDLAQQPEAASDYLRTTTQARLWLGGGLMLALVILAPFLSRDTAVVAGLQISAPLIFILPSFGAYTAIFRAHQIMWPIPWLNLGMLVVQVVLTALVFLAGGGVLAALAVNTLTSAGQLVAAWGIWRWKFHKPTTEKASESAQLRVMPILRRATPFALAALLAAIQTRAGTILLESLADAAQVGYYAAATRFSEAGRMIPNALFGALFPALAALASQPAAMNQTFRRVMLGLAGFALALGVAFSLFGQPVIRLTYGEAFMPAVPALQIAVWSLLPALLRAGRTVYWYGRGREALTNWVTAAALLLQIGLSLWLIPVMGAAGAALALLATEIMGLILLTWPPGAGHEGGQSAV